MDIDQARTASQQTGAHRWTLTTNLNKLYKNGEGSVYTGRKAPNVPTSSKAPPLNKQISEGVKFFGYGRGNVSKRLGEMGKDKDLGTMAVGGGAEGAFRQGDTSFLGGFNTFRAPRSGESDFGTNLITSRDASWYTQGLTGIKKYGNEIAGMVGKNFGARGGASESRGADGSGAGGVAGNRA